MWMCCVCLEKWLSMSKKIIVEQLGVLASDDTKRSKAARLRDVIDEVEATLAAGITRSEVVKKLAENGLEMALATFNSELQKIRKKRGKPSVIPVKSNNQSVTKKIQPTSIQPVIKSDSAESKDGSKPADEYGSHDPRAIDAIMRSTPDLAKYERLYKESKRNNKP
jgi:hypothetical protein